MRVDIVCAEAQLAKAANNLAEYGDFLGRTIEAYLLILADLQNKGIQDAEVCAKLSALAQSLIPYKTAIPKECEAMVADVRSYISGIEKADDFRFPAELTESLTTLVEQFCHRGVS